VMVVVSAFTRGVVASPSSRRFERVEEPEWSASR
jgi:hypothetical protein